MSRIEECLNQLTDLLRAAGKCQPGDTPHKVTRARAELAAMQQPATDLEAIVRDAAAKYCDGMLWHATAKAIREHNPVAVGSSYVEITDAICDALGRRPDYAAMEKRLAEAKSDAESWEGAYRQGENALREVIDKRDAEIGQLKKRLAEKAVRADTDGLQKSIADLLQRLAVPKYRWYKNNECIRRYSDSDQQGVWFCNEIQVSHKCENEVKGSANWTLICEPEAVKILCDRGQDPFIKR